MEKITLNGIRYVALGELERLRRNIILDIYEKYEKDENGQYHLADTDIGAVNALSHLMVQVLQEEYDECAPDRDKCNEMIAGVREEAFKHRWCIAAKDGNRTVYFRKWCDKFGRQDGKGEGEITPVFTDMRRLAKVWSDHYLATVTLESLKRETKVDGLKILPAAYLSGEAQRRLIDAIFGTHEKPDEWCIFLAPENGEESMWFSEWIKYRDDMPEGEVKEACKNAGLKPGQSMPMFADAVGVCLTFADKGMAEKTAERIADVFPEFKGRLHVMIYEEDIGNDTVPDDT